MASPAVLAIILVASLVALLPVWQLHRAGFSRGSLASAWILYAIAIVVGLRFPGPFRLLLPVVVVAYVAPFALSPERLNRLLRRRPPAPRTIKNVTPPTPPGLGAPPPGAPGNGEDRRRRP